MQNFIEKSSRLLRDKCCENPDDHRPFTSTTFQLMMTKDIGDDNYEIEEDEAKRKSVAVVQSQCLSVT